MAEGCKLCYGKRDAAQFIEHHLPLPPLGYGRDPDSFEQMLHHRAGPAKLDDIIPESGEFQSQCFFPAYGFVKAAGRIKFVVR